MNACTVLHVQCSYLAQHAQLRGRQPRHGLLQLGPHCHVRLGDEEQPAAGKCEEMWEMYEEQAAMGSVGAGGGPR